MDHGDRTVAHPADVFLQRVITGTLLVDGMLPTTMSHDVASILRIGSNIEQPT